MGLGDSDLGTTERAGATGKGREGVITYSKYLRYLDSKAEGLHALRPEASADFMDIAGNNSNLKKNLEKSMKISGKGSPRRGTSDFD